VIWHAIIAVRQTSEDKGMVKRGFHVAVFFFPRTQYAGSSVGMKTRLLRQAIGELHVSPDNESHPGLARAFNLERLLKAREMGFKVLVRRMPVNSRKRSSSLSAAFCGSRCRFSAPCSMKVLSDTTVSRTSALI
jgi:hypothetical protein